MNTPMRLHIRITLMKRFAFVIEQPYAQFCSFDGLAALFFC